MQLSTTFLILAVCAMLGHALQTTLMASYYRKLDALSAVAARGVSLGLTGLPLLFIAKAGAFSESLNYLDVLGAAAGLAVLGNWACALAFRYLTIGIAVAFQQALLVIAVTLIGAFAFNELLSVAQYVCLTLIVLSSALLSVRGSDNKLKIDKNTLIGLAYCTLFSLFLACGFSLVARASRELGPFVTAYCWEFSIGLMSLVIVVLRSLLKRVAAERITNRDLLKITLYSSPTVIGTGCYAIATTLGPIAVVNAILSSMIVITTILGYFLYKEKISLKEGALMALIFCAVIALRLIG